jgi:hypothetical protein
MSLPCGQCPVPPGLEAASSGISVSLAIRLINPAADPAMCVIGVTADPAMRVVGVAAVATVGLIADIVSNMRDDVLAHCKEVITIVKCPPDHFGRMIFAGIECCNEFCTEG